jgi:Holliday junction resolvase
VVIASKKTFIIKANGHKVLFNEKKILSTCRRAGADKKTALRILKKVYSQIYPEIKTHNIYKLVLRAISEEKDGQALHQRYQLKEAIMKLGPNGFAFENYVGNILEHYGLHIKGIRSRIKGRCSNHEIDLIAISNKKKFMIECKHHSTRGGFIGLKVALYTHARFLDTSPKFEGEVIVCNAKVSQTAKKYAKCIGQQIFSWRYPAKNSLEKTIEKYNLYPITILNLSQNELRIFSESNMMIAKDLLRYDDAKIARMTGISKKRIKNMQRLVEQIFYSK